MGAIEAAGRLSVSAREKRNRMVELEIKLAPEEQQQIQREAERAHLPLDEWVRQQLLRKSAPAFITDDGEVFEIPDLPEDLGRACVLASEATLMRLWDTSEEDAARQDSMK